MLILKIMSGQDLPDSDTSKNYRLITMSDSAQVEFQDRAADPNDRHDPRRQRQHVVAIIADRGDENVYLLEGNAYLMNEQGKTISSRSTLVS